MNTALFYQLRERLYTAAVAGCYTINEDFRLKRAVEEFEPLANANKVFGRLYNMCSELFISEKPAPILVDCIALCDALAVTQGTYKDSSGTFENTGVADCEPSEIRYSLLKNEQNIESRDPRVINEYLSSLKANTSEYTKKFIINYGRGIVPALKQRIDMTNPKEHGMIVEMVGQLSGSDENDWYLSLVDNEDTPQAVRVHAVSCLGYDKSNADRLLELYKTEKAVIKDAVALALVKLDVPECEVVLKKITSGKFAKKNAEIISLSHSKTAVDFAIDYAEKAFDEFNKAASQKKYDLDLAIDMLSNKPEAENVLYYLSNQDGKIIRRYHTCNMLLHNLAENTDEKFRVLIENLYRRNPEYFAMAYFMMNSFENRGVKISDLPETANKHRDAFIRIFENIQYDDENKCYMCGENAIDDGKFYDIIEFLTDTSYLGKTNILLSAKKKEEERYRDISSALACDAINTIFNSAAEQDKDRISELRLDFFKAVMKTRPNETAFVSLCQNEPQYISENPHLLEDLVMYKLDGGWFRSVFDEIPRDIIDIALIPLYKKLKTLKDKKYPGGNVSRQIRYIEFFLQENGYDAFAI